MNKIDSQASSWRSLITDTAKGLWNVVTGSVRLCHWIAQPAIQFALPLVNGTTDSLKTKNIQQAPSSQGPISESPQMPKPVEEAQTKVFIETPLGKVAVFNGTSATNGSPAVAQKQTKNANPSGKAFTKPLFSKNKEIFEDDKAFSEFIISETKSSKSDKKPQEMNPKTEDCSGDWLIEILEEVKKIIEESPETQKHVAGFDWDLALKHNDLLSGVQFQSDSKGNLV